MGVQGLKSFIENNPGILKSLPFRDSKLIIDGCNFYYSLYFNSELDQMHGGEYEAFEDLITQFITNLRDCDIQPYVVIDGGSDHTDKKFETLKSRAEEKIRRASDLSIGRRGTCLPLHVKNVFRQTLYKLKVPFVQCTEEADWEIAALANQWDCPVLSNDSDFYIFNLTAGLLPIGLFSWRNISVNKDTKKKFIPTQHFIFDRLCASFNHMNKDLLPVLACILGNDYVKLQNISSIAWEMYSNLSGHFARIDGLFTWLSKFLCPEAAIDGVLKFITDNKEKYVVREALIEGIKEYELTKGSLAQFFNSNTPIACTGPQRALPAWILMQLHEGKINSFIVDVLVLKRIIMNPQVEDFQQPSSNETSLPLRQVVYGLLLSGEQQTSTDKCCVTEYERQGLTLTCSEVKATKVKERLQLETLWKETHALRLQVFLETLGVSSAVLGIPPDLRLQVFVTRYWLVHARPQPNQLHLWGLLLGMVYGRLNITARTQIDRRLSKKSRGKVYLDHEVAHLYSQWQSCLFWSLCLNQFPFSRSLRRHVVTDELGTASRVTYLLRELSKTPMNLACRLYQGTLVHQAAREFKRGIKPESLLVKGSEAEKLFRQMRDAVLSLVDEDDVRRISTRYRNRAVDKTQSDNRCKNQSVDELSSFEHIDIEDYYDDDYYDDNDDGKERKDDKSDMNESFLPARTRHKSKARNADNPSKKSERCCYE